MPQILFVADECHAMFNSSMSNNHKLFREMSEVIVRVAKEGRNQGVHLILATQTLAQTDISSEIINNISDRYLLKCASADSEKMIPNSSGKTRRKGCHVGSRMP
jgi:DNA segregation ATPase FtsK/SpoIIIE-like protein